MEKQTVVVITDSDGNVVATQTRSEGSMEIPEVPYARLVAGPGQERYEVEVEVSERLISREAIDDYHRRLGELIKENRLPRSE